MEDGQKEDVENVVKEEEGWVLTSCLFPVVSAVRRQREQRRKGLKKKKEEK